MFIAQIVLAQDRFQLAPPLVTYPSSFFSKSVTLTAAFDQPGTKIVYTTDGSEPGINSPVYTKPLIITANTDLQIRTVGNGFEPSIITKIFFYGGGIPIKQISFSEPNPKYATKNKNILNDHIGGLNNVNNGNWLGYQGDTAYFTIELNKEEKIKSLFANFLQNQGSWIFLPQKIVISFWDSSSGQWKELMKESFLFPESAKNLNHRCLFDFPVPVSTTQLKITAYPLLKIPDWHPGKGNPAWFFIDEIKLY